MWDTHGWHLDFPAELAGYERLRFAGGAPGIVMRDIGNNKKYLYAVTDQGRLAQIWDTNRWNLDFPAEAAERAELRFKGTPLAAATDMAAGKRELYLLTRDGQLTWITNANGPWQVSAPAERTHPGFRFAGSVAGYSGFYPGGLIPGPQPDSGAHGGPQPEGSDDGHQPESEGQGDDPPVYTGFLGLFAVSVDDRLVQINAWDFPAELAGYPDLRFSPSPDVFPFALTSGRKSLHVITADGRLAQLWDIHGWHLDFPAERAGHPDLRFAGSPAVFPRDWDHNKKSIYAVTTDGRLAQIWDTNHWHLDFPAESAGHPDLRFAGSPAVLIRNIGQNKKAIYALTTDGRLAQMWDTNHWHLDFPAELAGHPDLRFKP
jgi:hypothetical protein